MESLVATPKFALRLSSDVIALHLTAMAGPGVDEHELSLQQQWAEDVLGPARAAGAQPPRLALARSPYRRFLEPLVEFIRGVEKEYPNRTIAVLIPELVEQHWWQQLLHLHRGRRLRRALFHHGGSQIVVIEVPWHLGEA